ENLTSDPQQIQRAGDLHADKQPVKLAKQEVEAEKSGRGPHDGSRPEAQRNLDAVRARARNGGARGGKKARTRAHDREQLNEADGRQYQEICSHWRSRQVMWNSRAVPAMANSGASDAVAWTIEFEISRSVNRAFEASPNNDSWHLRPGR